MFSILTPWEFAVNVDLLTSSSRFVRMGSYHPSRSEVSDIFLSVSSSITYSSSSSSSVSASAFSGFGRSLRWCHVVSHPIGRTFHLVHGDNGDFPVCITAGYGRISSVFLFCLKQWSRDNFLVYYFSRVRSHGVFDFDLYVRRPNYKHFRGPLR